MFLMQSRPAALHMYVCTRRCTVVVRTVSPAGRYFPPCLSWSLIYPGETTTSRIINKGEKNCELHAIRLEKDREQLRLQRLVRSRELRVEMSTGLNAARSALQGILKNNETTGWDAAWVQKVTPWDLGGVHPVIDKLLATGSLPAGRVLVPGCGSGYDVVALAGPTRHAVGLDLSETASAQARKAAEGEPGAPYAEFVTGDFFAYSPETPFDLVFDYTFFCALNPSMRPSWAKKMAELIVPGGELMTLMFPVDEYSGGPPYAVSEKAYEDVLRPLGFECYSVEAVEGPKARLGKEKLGRWRKALAKI